MPLPKNNRIFAVLLAITIFCTLINSNNFGSSVMAAYFLYVVMASVLVSFIGITFYKNKATGSIILPIPILFFILFVVYYFLQSLFIPNEDVNLRHIALLVHCLLFTCCYSLLDKEALDVKFVFKAISIFALLESLVCFAQYFSLVKSNNSFFAVTGTWINPNVTAMFLAMAIPALWVLFKEIASTRKFLVFIAILVIIAICLLQCRTAIIGLFAEIVLLVGYQYNIVSDLRNKFNTLKLLLLMTSIVVVVAAGFYLYKVKQSSADGRKLIWKISAHMVAQKPLSGFGYGMFEHDYNLAQAKYFADNLGTPQEIRDASFVHMAYSEIVENAVEGGLIAICILVAIFVSLLINPPSEKSGQGNFNHSLNVASYSGIVAFALMSVFNFTIQAIPVMCLFVLWASIRTVSVKNDSDSIYKKLPRWNPFFMKYAFIVLGIGVFISQAIMMNAYLVEQNAKYLIKKHKIEKAISIFAAQENRLRHYSNYWEHYAATLYIAKQYTSATAQIETAVHYTSDPELYTLLGNCYIKLGNTMDAITAFTMAQNIQPNRFAPRYALMKLHESHADTINALKVANELSLMQPKIPSEKVDFYKKEANKTIEKYNQRITVF